MVENSSQALLTGVGHATPNHVERFCEVNEAEIQWLVSFVYFLYDPYIDL